MKTIEEKARAYDEALEKARQLCAYPTTKSFISDLQDLFPELIESEDERIRKEILSFCQNRADNYPNDPKYANIGNWISWLEKQGKVKESHISQHENRTCEENCNSLTSEEKIEKAAQEWDSKANFNPFYMTMDGDKPTGVLQDITTHKESFKAGVNWILKSLRPQNTWKPSDEHIGLLQAIINEPNNAASESCQIVLKDILEQLKKLKEG